MNTETRHRIHNLTDDELRTLFWQVFGSMEKTNPGQMAEAIFTCLPGIEAGRVV